MLLGKDVYSTNGKDGELVASKGNRAVTVLVPKGKVDSIDQNQPGATLYEWVKNQLPATGTLLTSQQSNMPVISSSQLSPSVPATNPQLSLWQSFLGIVGCARRQPTRPPVIACAPVCAGQTRVIRN